MSCQDIREGAATALLTSSAYPQPVEEHLRNCHSCRDEVTALCPLPALLGTISDVEREAIEPPDEQLLVRVLRAAAEVRDRRRRRRVKLLSAAAAAALIGLPLGALIHNATDTSAVAPVAIQRIASDPTSGVLGKVWLTPASWGSDLTFAIRGIPTGARCSLVVVTRGGGRETAATWRAEYAGTARISGAVTAAPSEIERIDVIADQGGVLLRLPVAATG